MKCPSCNAELRDGSVFCTNCGTQLGGSYQNQQYVEPVYKASPVKTKKGAPRFLVVLLSIVLVLLLGGLVTTGIFYYNLSKDNEALEKENEDLKSKKDSKKSKKQEKEATATTETTEVEQSESTDDNFSSGLNHIEWSNIVSCDYEHGDYAFAVDGMGYEFITPWFQANSGQIFVCTQMEFGESGNYYTDNSRYFDVELYDVAEDRMVASYRGMYDNIEGGVSFETVKNHTYYVTVRTHMEKGEKLRAHGHGHVYFE